MAQVPANAAKAFDELSALLGGAGSRLGGLSQKAAVYSPEIKAKLSTVGAKFSPDFLGDFFATTSNSSPAATPPESAQALTLSPAMTWGGLLLLGVGVLWIMSRGK